MFAAFGDATSSETGPRFEPENATGLADALSTFAHDDGERLPVDVMLSPLDLDAVVFEALPDDHGARPSRARSSKSITTAVSAQPSSRGKNLRTGRLPDRRLPRRRRVDRLQRDRAFDEPLACDGHNQPCADSGRNADVLVEFIAVQSTMVDQECPNGFRRNAEIFRYVSLRLC